MKSANRTWHMNICAIWKRQKSESKACIEEELPLTTELEENLQNGVILAKLGHFFAPKIVPLRRIYDKDLTRFKSSGLHYRHTDNVVQFFGACEDAGLPSIFYPDTSDVYDRKNMPKLIYCIHALSLFLHKLGKAPLIQNLVGKAEFTEEEISAMRGELDKYGIQMPAFGKIGGILATEMPVDEAALHAAVIAINEALDRSPQETVTALQNPMAHISNIHPEFSGSYHENLSNVKNIKAMNASNRETGEEAEEDKDVYDVLLTQAEIQAQINEMNVQETLRQLDECLSLEDAAQLLDILSSPYLRISQLKKDNSPAYLTNLSRCQDEKQNNINSSTPLNISEIQQAIIAANQDCDVNYQKLTSVDKVNKVLNSGSKDELYETLVQYRAHYPPVHEAAAALYFEEFKSIREEKGSELVYEEVYGGVQVLSAVATVNESIRLSPEDLLEALHNENVHLVAVEPENIALYQDDLSTALDNKLELENPLLTHSELQEAVDTANDCKRAEYARCEIVEQINDALSSADAAALFELLTAAESGFENVYPEQMAHYFNSLKRSRGNNPEGQSLTWNEIQATVDLANAQAMQALEVSKLVMKVNDALAADSDADTLYTALSAADLELESVQSDCSSLYLDNLREAKSLKSQSGSLGGGWLCTTLSDGTEMFYDSSSGTYQWALDNTTELDSSLLDRTEIQDVVRQTTADEDRKVFLDSNTDKIVKLQSTFRGYTARKQYKDRLNYLKNQEPQVVKLQAWVKGKQQRKAYEERMALFKANEESIVKMQSSARAFLAKKKYKERLDFLSSQSDFIVKIQSAWRGKKTRDDYQSLMYAENPALNAVRKFAHLLDQSDTDYAEEIELQKQRQQVVAAIRNNQQLEKDANSMDIKIGLLVKNRITLEEVVAHEGKLSKTEQESSYSVGRGLTSLNKESQERLSAYQHLFYQLQVDPQYLARLILVMPQQQSTKFIESVILTLYNYASNPREEYLLLKLFSTSLEHEILERVDNMADIVTGNPLAIKMVVDFHRNARGRSYLRDMLNPLVTSLLDDKSVKINTNPIEVYKSWVNQQETETGVSSGLPYDVTNEEALKHEGVQQLMEESIQQLRVWSDKFLSLILSSLDQIPYGMRCIAKVMYDSLTKKFPEASEKDVLKIVGNLLYYRYINSTIAAPDAYDIIDMDAEKGALTPDQRRNLGSVAKILQFAASNKGFGGGDSQHLACLNTYIKGSHEKFKSYFRKACDVEAPEVHFNIDQYTEATLVVKPQIYITLDDLLNTHSKLLEYQSKIAPEPTDIIHELLKDLGEKSPTIEELLGEGSGGNKEEEVCLTLSNKHSATVDEKSDLAGLLISTKQQTIDIIRCQLGDTLTAVLKSETTDEQEAQHTAMIAQQEQVDARAEDKEFAVTRSKSVKGQNERKLPLAEKKVKVKEDLARLAEAKLLSDDGHYQEMVNLIAQDIRNQRRYRAARREDLEKLKETMNNLQTKRSFFESQIDYYKMYVQACLSNMLSAGKRRSRSSYISVSSTGTPEEEKKPKKGKKETKKQVVKYNAAKLHERGIVLEIDGCNPSQLKNVQFEISTTDDPAVFQCTAKVMTVSETHLLKLQELLELQYEGVAVMLLFERAKVNVNLLLHLLNKKFYITK
ncbi:ras GTPase-activating-like protein IQGAP1 isoform X2 [Watersipora subatra]|uniref:ras GTPase-activating-like protein IQGAP1 isoform X2 n=1 Tax=Watersipora subatra TaxID=2589382 RepID=UPI00355B62EB